MTVRRTRLNEKDEHSHAKYLVAIVLLAIISGVLGLAQFSGASLPGVSRVPEQPQSFTLVHGTATAGSLGSILAIYFEPGPLTSVVEGTGHTYRLHLVSGTSYNVLIAYDSYDVSGIRQCTAQPSRFAPSGGDMLQDFHC